MIFPFVFLCSLCFSRVESLRFFEEKNYHWPKDMTPDDLVYLAQLSDQFHFSTVLDQILRTRMVGSKGHFQVGNFIIRELLDLGWTIKEDIFRDQTPLGTLKFRNIVAVLNEEAERYLVLACHYDSLSMKDFVGATDSAVPCAMLINLAKTMEGELSEHKTTRLSLMLIFFDGEEAFVEWSPTDSLYGSRHLAQMWEDTPYHEGTNELSRIDLMILLDLIGAPGPRFMSYFKDTEMWYQVLANAEDTLASLGLLHDYSEKYFTMLGSQDYNEDDHVPFLQRKVYIIHMIADPYPSVWHTLDDDFHALDFDVIENLNKIIRVFVYRYMKGSHLERNLMAIAASQEEPEPSEPKSEKDTESEAKDTESEAKDTESEAKDTESEAKDTESEAKDTESEAKNTEDESE